MQAKTLEILIIWKNIYTNFKLTIK